MDRWLPEEPIACIQEAIRHLDFAPTTQEDQQQVEAALASVKSRVAELEAEARGARIMLAAIVSEAGGEVRVNDEALMPHYEMQTHRQNRQTIIHARRA
jgi:hypothetical protein